MPITDHQRTARKKYIGSSDAPAICGVSPWSNPGKVYLEKTADLEDADETEAQERGNYVEPSILNWFADRHQKQIVRNQYRVNGIQCANLDALVVGEPAIVEAKSGSEDAGWGAVPDGIPDYVRVQAQHQMLVTDIRLVYIPALIVEFGRPVFRLYRQEWDDDLADAVKTAEQAFWDKHIVPKVPPPEAPPLEVVKRIRRVPNKTVCIDDELVRSWQAAKAEAKSAKELAEIAEAELLAAMGDAECATTNLGTLTYLEYQRKAYIKEVEASSYRSLKFKEKKTKEK